MSYCQDLKSPVPILLFLGVHTQIYSVTYNVSCAVTPGNNGDIGHYCATGRHILIHHYIGHIVPLGSIRENIAHIVPPGSMNDEIVY